MKQIHFLFIGLLAFSISTTVQAQYEAEILSLDYPAEMSPGSPYQLDLTFKNTGEETLGRSTCTLKVSYLSGPSLDAGKSLTIEKDLTSNISPRNQYTFRWTVWGPLVPGDYKMSVALMKGSTTLAKEVVTTEVEESYEADVTFGYPGLIMPEMEYNPLQATVRNSGKATWPSGKYELVAKVTTFPSDASKDDIEAFEFEEEIDLSELTAGNEKFHKFKDKFEAPSGGGAYNVDVTLHFNGKPFNANNNQIRVSPSVKNEDQKANIKAKVPKKLYPGKKYDVSFDIQNSGRVKWDEGAFTLNSIVTKKPSDLDKKLFEVSQVIDGNEMRPGASTYVPFPDISVPNVPGIVEVEYVIMKNGKKTEMENAEITVRYEIIEILPDPKETTTNSSSSVKNKKQKATIEENVTTKIYPEKSYFASFKIKNSGKGKWDKGSYSLKATVKRKPSSLDDKVFESTIKFDGSEMMPGKYVTVKFPEIAPPDVPGDVEVVYEILKDGKETEIEDAQMSIRYEIMEVLPELNIGRITLEDDMVSGKQYTLKLDMKNYGDISAFEDDWVVKCKTRTIKPSNYRPPRGTFDFSIDGIDLQAGQTKYISGKIKAPKVDQETSIRLEFEVYFKGDKMGGPKTFDIKIKS